MSARADFLATGGRSRYGVGVLATDGIVMVASISRTASRR